MLIKKFLILVSFTCLLYVLHPTDTYADTTPGFKLTLTPIYKTISINPGSSASGTTDLINQGNLPIFYSVYTTPYSVTNENYSPYLVALPGKPNVSKWFSLNKSGGVINKNEIANVEYTINVPPNTLPGEYFAILFAESKQINIPTKANQINVSNRIGEIYYIVVPGKEVKKTNIVSWKSNRIQKNSIVSSLRIENLGTLHYLANVKINIKNVFNNKSYASEVNKIVLPQTIRRIDVNSPNNLSFGIYKINGSVTTYETTKLKNIYVILVTKTFLITMSIVLGLTLALILLYVFYRSIIRLLMKLRERGKP